MSVKVDLLKDKDIDQITYQIVKHKIWQVLWEGRATMEKISGSVVVTEAKEVLCGLYNAKGGDGVEFCRASCSYTGNREYDQKAFRMVFRNSRDI